MPITSIKTRIEGRMYALCFKETLDTEHRKYVAVIPVETDGVTSAGYTPFEDAVGLWDAVKFHTPGLAENVGNSTDFSDELTVVEITVGIQH